MIVDGADPGDDAVRRGSGDEVVVVEELTLSRDGVPAPFRPMTRRRSDRRRSLRAVATAPLVALDDRVLVGLRPR